MRKILIAFAVSLLGLSVSAAHAASSPWRITKTEWTPADEQGFGAFVRKIAESGCTTTVSCLKGPGNPYRDSDPPDLIFRADCAKFVYMLRAYYAWKNGLPFAYVDYISGVAADLRFSPVSNAPVSRRDLVDFGGGIDAVAALRTLHDKVWTATFRMDPAQDQLVMPDFYAPKLAPGSIRAGTAIYDINGHVGIVYEIAADGRILYMDAHPDESVSRSVYGPQFGQSPQRLGGGFKNFRPMKLEGAVQQPDGSYLGGRVVLAANAGIQDYSLEQYRGNLAATQGDGPDAKFEYSAVPLGLFAYVRAAMSGGGVTLNPVYELRTGMRGLCHELRERNIQVSMSVRAGLHARPHPPKLPGNTVAGADAEWEEHASFAADARLRNSAAELYRNVQNANTLSAQRDSRIAFDGASLQDGLQQAYAEEAAACRIAYSNSVGAPVTLTLGEVLSRLSTISFDPYHCVERRWGATTAQELAACREEPMKTRWYFAQQSLRNRADAGHTQWPAFTLVELETLTSAAGAQPPADLRWLTAAKAIQDAQVSSRVATDAPQ